MHETWTTVVGNAATRPDFWETAAGVAVARFRLAATVRRWDRKSEGWVDAYTSFYTVWTWRTLAANVAASVSLGEPLLVHGTLRVREREKEREREPEKAQQGAGAGSGRAGPGGGSPRRSTRSRSGTTSRAAPPPSGGSRRPNRFQTYRPGQRPSDQGGFIDNPRSFGVCGAGNNSDSDRLGAGPIGDRAASRSLGSLSAQRGLLSFEFAGVAHQLTGARPEGKP
ncbi:single-stranded DNA-binding protein [Streptomyces sp. RTd22]|uniref:single-stranded DNA-binding protein n=1 Tax=Streptomyces sp. RTd22 TaxID=1841249 RepID=UPI003B63E49B